MPTFATLCYLRYRGRVLMLRKGGGPFGEGKWNAPGGKLLLGEDPSRAAVQEMFQESGLRVSGPGFHGVLNFYLGESKELDQTVFVFSCRNYSGKIRRGREGELKWFPVEEIPYDSMWDDDRVWLPLLLQGKSFIGDFYFTDSYREFVSH